MVINYAYKCYRLGVLGLSQYALTLVIHMNVLGGLLSGWPVERRTWSTNADVRYRIYSQDCIWILERDFCNIAPVRYAICHYQEEIMHNWSWANINYGGVVKFIAGFRFCYLLNRF